MQILRGAEKRVHGALAVRRHQHIAAPGRRAAGRWRGSERYAGGADIVAERAAELIVLDLADKGRSPPRHDKPDNGIGRRAAGDLDRRAHGVIDRLGTRLVDQRHRAFVHALLEQKIFFGAGDHIDNRIADAENVVTG